MTFVENVTCKLKEGGIALNKKTYAFKLSGGVHAVPVPLSAAKPPPAVEPLEEPAEVTSEKILSPALCVR